MRTIAAASLAALLATALAAPADAASKTAAAKAPAGKPLIAISQIALADTSGEKPDTAGTIWTRIKALTNQIGTGLSGSGLYDTKVVPKANCEDYSETCLGKWAKDTGGNLIMIGTVLKMTPTVSHFWVGIFKPDGTTRLFYRDIKIDSDSEASWKRAGSDLVAAVLAAKPGR